MKKLVIVVALFLVMVSGSFAQRFTSPFNPTINANSPYWPHPNSNWADIHGPNWNTNQPRYGNYGAPGSYGLYYNPYYNQYPGGYVVPRQ
jgi:hypothetical protein